MIKRFHTGDRISRFPGNSWNELADGVEGLLRLGLRPPPPESLGAASPVVVQIQNNTGNDLGKPPSGEDGYWPGIVRLGDPLVLPDGDEATDATAFGEPTFDGLEPAATDDQIAIVRDYLAADGVGKATLIGYAWCRVELADAGAEAHEFAQPKPGDANRMAAASSGPAKIHWIADTPETPTYPLTKWALVILGGGIGDHFQLIRATAAAAVTPADPVFFVEFPVALEELAKTPAALLLVANTPGLTLTLGDWVYAAYRKDAVVIPADPEAEPPEEEIRVDWEAIPTSAGASTPPLRHFVLTANKTLASATATVNWLTMGGFQLTGDVTIYDPVGNPLVSPKYHFSGRIADDLYTDSPAAYGQAILRRDLAAEPVFDRWEIINMEGLAEYVEAEIYKLSNYPSAGSTVKVRFKGTLNNTVWDILPPAAVNGELTLLDNVYFFDTSLITEPDFSSAAESAPSRVYMQLVFPDTNPPTYRVIQSESVPVAKRVRGSVVGDITTSASTFTIDGISAVHGGEVPSAPLTVRQIFQQGYFDNQPTEAIWNETDETWDNLPSPNLLGCHLLQDAYGFISVTPSTLAGSGLSVSTGTGPGGCDQLTASGSGCIVVGGGLEVEADEESEYLGCLKVNLCTLLKALPTQPPGGDTSSGSWFPCIIDDECVLVQVTSACAVETA